MTDAQKEREAIVAWLRETQSELNANFASGLIDPFALRHHLESTKWVIEAIERGDHLK